MIWRRSHLHLGHFCKYAHRLAGNFRCLHIKFPDGSSVAARDGLYQARRACLELFSTISGICTTVSHSINACIVYNILLKFKINVEFFSEILKFSHHCNKESGENIDIRFSSRVKKWVSSQRLSCQLLKHWQNGVQCVKLGAVCMCRLTANHGAKIINSVDCQCSLHLVKLIVYPC